LVDTRPYRSPHHTISDAGLIGGGAVPRPGEVSLGHNGVLFLDELPEFQRNVLEVMRQPFEDGAVTISRAAVSVTFPSTSGMDEQEPRVYGLQIRRRDRVDQESIDNAVLEILRFAKAVDGEYDGWETELVRPSSLLKSILKKVGLG